MGEGAGVVVLEEYEHASARGAKIYGEVLGYGMSGDAYHITAPAEGGEGAFRAMRPALKPAGIDAGEIDYVNAHGTSTPPATRSSCRRSSGCSATRRQGLTMSSTKSAIGHLLGAAGAVEAIFSLLAIRDGVAPPTLNLDKPCAASAIDRVAERGAAAQDRRGAVELLRLRRHQRLHPVQGRGLSPFERRPGDVPGDGGTARRWDERSALLSWCCCSAPARAAPSLCASAYERPGRWPSPRRRGAARRRRAIGARWPSAA